MRKSVLHARTFLHLSSGQFCASLAHLNFSHFACGPEAVLRTQMWLADLFHFCIRPSCSVSHFWNQVRLLTLLHFPLVLFSYCLFTWISTYGRLSCCSTFASGRVVPFHTFPKELNELNLIPFHTTQWNKIAGTKTHFPLVLAPLSLRLAQEHTSDFEEGLDS